LVESVVSLEHDDVLVLSVMVSRDIHCSSILDVYNGTVVILEELEPPGIGVPNLQVG